LTGAKPQLTQSSIVIIKTISDAQVAIIAHCRRNILEELPMEWNYYLGMKPQFKVISTFEADVTIVWHCGRVKLSWRM